MPNAYRVKALKTARFQQPIPILESRQSSHSFLAKSVIKKCWLNIFPLFFLQMNMAWIRRQVKKWKGRQMKKSEAKKQPQGLSSNALACKNKHGLRLGTIHILRKHFLGLF